MIAEDFAWCLPVGAKSDQLFVACSSDPERQGTWRVFVLQDRGILAGILGRGSKPGALEAVYAAVRETLANAPEVQALREE